MLTRAVSHFGPLSDPSALTMVTLQSSTPGPVVVVTANLHGDECAGIGIIHALLPYLETALERGTIHLCPTLNPAGLRSQCRRHPEDNRDLNRVFPGDPRGSPADRLATAIWRHLKHLDPRLVIDLHSDAPASIPYALVDRPFSLPDADAYRMTDDLTALANASGLTVIREYRSDAYQRFQLDRSLTGCLVNRARVAAITIETGPRLYLDPDATRTGLLAVSGVLGHLGLVDAPLTPHRTRVAGGPWCREAGPRVSRAGFLAPCCHPGEILHAQDAVAEVRALTGVVLERIPAQETCFVVSLPECTPVEPGDTTCTLAVLENRAF